MEISCKFPMCFCFFGRFCQLSAEQPLFLLFKFVLVWFRWPFLLFPSGVFMTKHFWFGRLFFSFVFIPVTKFPPPEKEAKNLKKFFSSANFIILTSVWKLKIIPETPDNLAFPLSFWKHLKLIVSISLLLASSRNSSCFLAQKIKNWPRLQSFQRKFPREI